MATELSPQRKERINEAKRKQSNRWQRMNGTAVRYNADGTVKEEIKTWLPFLLEAKKDSAKKKRLKSPRKVGLLA